MTSSGVDIKRLRRQHSRLVGERIEDRMTELGLTQTSLADRLTEGGFRISQPLVSRAVHGAPLDDTELIAFARALKVTVTWLLGLTENPRKWNPDVPLDQAPPWEGAGPSDQPTGSYPGRPEWPMPSETFDLIPA